MAKTRKNRIMMKEHTHLDYHSDKVIPHHATMHGVNDWHNAMFEKLGWMFLAKEKGYGYKIAAYKKGVEHLVKTIENMMHEYTEADRKHDLHVLWTDAMFLERLVKEKL